MKASLDGLIDSLQSRLVVAGDQQLELRRELKEILAHESGRDLVATRKRLDLAFGPAATLFLYVFHGWS